MKVEAHPEKKPFQEFALRMLDLHSLIAEGRDESDAGDEIRDDLDLLWKDLSEGERELDGALSENLYHLFVSDEELKRPPNPADIVEKREVILELAASRARGGNPARELNLLAEIPPNIEPDAMFYQRARVLYELGLVQIAIQFLRRSILLSKDGSRGFLLVEWVRLAQSPEAAIQEYRKLRPSIKEGGDFMDLAYIMALIDVFDAEGSQDDLKEASTLAEREFKKAVSDSDFPRIMIAHSAMLYSSLLERQGKGGSVSNVLWQALGRDPENPLLRVKLAVALYDEKPEVSVSIFEDLVHKQSPSIWPYLFLSHFYLREGRWPEAGNVAIQGLSRTKEPRIQADLWETWAISIAESGGDLGQARQCFEEALRLHPENERIVQNFKALQERMGDRLSVHFEIPLRPSKAPDWQKEQRQAMSVSIPLIAA